MDLVHKAKYKKVIKMFRRALKFAIGPSIGITLGGIIIPRIMFPNLYNETYPSILVHAVLYFAVGYIVSFLVALLIEWVKSK
jgi:O-antigen/teichoic acid export membrane protein